MSSFRIRPRFAHTIELDIERTRDQILGELARQAPHDFDVKSFPGMICLHFSGGRKKFWSPRLALALTPTPAGHTLIEGTYGPDAEVWSIFLYGYLLVGTAGLFAGIFGCAQLLTEAHPWGFWVLGAMVLGAVLLYVFAQFGQKLGAWQTFQLHQAYQTAIGRPTEIE